MKSSLKKDLKEKKSGSKDLSKGPKGNIKGRTKRSRAAYPALDVKFNLKTRTELIDYDYVDKLSDDEKQWLNKFTEEYTNDKINRKKLKKNLHNTKKLKKDCDDRNNSRNRDIYTTTKASGRLVYFEDLSPAYPDQKSEDDLINEIDENEKYKKIISDLDTE